MDTAAVKRGRGGGGDFTKKRGKRGREPASQISLAKESMTINDVVYIIVLCLYTTSHPCCSMHRERESVHT